MRTKEIPCELTSRSYRPRFAIEPRIHGHAHQISTCTTIVEEAPFSIGGQERNSQREVEASGGGCGLELAGRGTAAPRPG